MTARFAIKVMRNQAESASLLSVKILTARNLITKIRVTAWSATEALWHFQENAKKMIRCARQSIKVLDFVIVVGKGILRFLANVRSSRK